jgi:hypothetical protein
MTFLRQLNFFLVFILLQNQHSLSRDLSEEDKLLRLLLPLAMRLQDFKSRISDQGSPDLLLHPLTGLLPLQLKYSKSMSNILGMLWPKEMMQTLTLSTPLRQFYPNPWRTLLLS